MKEPNKKSFYVRLLSYDEAVLVVLKMRELGGYGNVTMQGIYLEGDDSLVKDIIDFMSNNVTRYEICFQHPIDVNKRIVSQYLKPKT